MKFPATPVFLTLIACLHLASAQEAGQAGQPDLDKLVLGLSSESFREREDATRALWEAGEEALAKLREASQSEDPETAMRAAAVLEKVELRITPETAPEILDHIKRFRTAPQHQKPNHINELRRRKAYFQLLKLYSMEKRPEAKAEIAPHIRGVAMLAAREALATEDFATAIRLLDMSAKEPNDLIALAWVYRCMGKLEAGMEDPPVPEGVATEDWEITLLRVKGDLNAAAGKAAASKQARLFAGLNVLQGDPMLWVRHNGFGDRRARALPEYVDIALKRWEGKAVNDHDYAPLLEMLRDGDPDDGDLVVSSLACLGRLPEAERQVLKRQRELGFQHYLSQERVPEALEAMGLDPQKPDYKSWAEQRFGRLMDEDDEGDENGAPLTDLLAVASFMETRGLMKELDAAYSAQLAKYADHDPEGFLDVMRALFQPVSGAPHFAAQSGAAWAGQDEGRWGELFDTAFGEENQVSEWLRWITDLEPGIGKPESFRVMMALFGMGADPEGLGDEWIAKAWKAAEEGPEKERDNHLEKIRSLAVARQDVATALKTRDVLDDGEKAAASWTSIDKYLSAAGRWKEAAEHLEGRGENVQASAEYHAYLAATLRRAGSEKGAAEHDLMAERLSLGYSPSCSRIAESYAYAGDMERAAEWWRRAAFHADVSSNDFIASLDTYARMMLEKGRWEIAASCYEALVQSYASHQFSGGSISSYSKARLNADLAKAMAVLPNDRPRALALLEGIHGNFVTDGILADDFFPLLRKAGLEKELGEWFGKSWDKISALIDRFPECDNTRNTAAWLASRARLRLKEAESHLQIALERNPGQAAYLDTMAEVHFAMGDRKGAVKWSDLSLLRYPLTETPYDTMIRRQNHRFRHAPLPE